MGNEALEPNCVTGNDDTGLRNLLKSSAANALLLGTETPEIAPDLIRLIRAWPTIGDETKREVLAMTEKAATDADSWR